MLTNQHSSRLSTTTLYYTKLYLSILKYNKTLSYISSLHQKPNSYAGAGRAEKLGGRCSPLHPKSPHRDRGASPDFARTAVRLLPSRPPTSSTHIRWRRSPGDTLVTILFYKIVTKCCNDFLIYLNINMGFCSVFSVITFCLFGYMICVFLKDFDDKVFENLMKTRCVYLASFCGMDLLATCSRNFFLNYLVS